MLQNSAYYYHFNEEIRQPWQTFQFIVLMSYYYNTKFNE